MNIRSIRRICGSLLVVAVCGSPSGHGQDRVQQQLDQVNSILQQLGRPPLPAVQAEPSGQSSLPNNPGTNPFAGTSRGVDSLHDSPALKASKGPQVRIGDDSIEIAVPGRRIHVNRPQSGTAGSSQPELPASVSALANLQSSALNRAAVYQQFAVAVSDFRSGKFDRAVSRLSEMEEQFMNEGLICQTYSLFLFQIGDFQNSAAWAYTGLQNAELPDWPAVQGMYVNPDDYSSKYRELQETCRREKGHTELHFLLACHHLTLGHREHAASELSFVLPKLKGDPILKKLQDLISQAPTRSPRPLAD